MTVWTAMKPRIRWDPIYRKWCCGIQLRIGFMGMFGNTPKHAYQLWHRSWQRYFRGAR